VADWRLQARISHRRKKIMTTKNTTRAHELMEQVTYRREMEDSYHVVIDGAIIGQVWLGWTRAGEHGWLSTKHRASICTDRHDATLRLVTSIANKRPSVKKEKMTRLMQKTILNHTGGMVRALNRTSQARGALRQCGEYGYTVHGDRLVAGEPRTGHFLTAKGEAFIEAYNDAD
jgi:hypothetical protein